jgi:hypothetical protein
MAFEREQRMERREQQQQQRGGGFRNRQQRQTKEETSTERGKRIAEKWVGFFWEGRGVNFYGKLNYITIS